MTMYLNTMYKQGLNKRCHVVKDSHADWYTCFARVIMMPFVLLVVHVSLPSTAFDRHQILVVIRVGYVDKSLVRRYFLVD